ncbi:MAG: phosphoenolpyruvate synthase [Chloroflexi bacterium]|nr:MAG: phosphoenolpyruvate synthase [Chloroflexota bacterium]HEY67936.1 phosphoenolpyruvate synthase [Thermoflexia bacterium]
MNRPEHIPKVIELYLQISQYPILSRRIRECMRQELFTRGVISREQFEQEVREKAILSQRREGLSDPFAQETSEVWQERLAQIRDHLTDFYFAYNLPHALFEEIVRTVLAERAPDQEVTLPFNPELAPWHILLAQAKEYAALPPEQQKQVGHHLEEITVVLIKSMISDQMAFVRLAKEFLTPEDFEVIGQRRIGEGKIGGKAAGMMLAWKILQREDPSDEMDLRRCVVIPTSYFIGADVFYDFHAINGLEEFINQKYKTQEEIEADYPRIREIYARGRFPTRVMAGLRKLLIEVGSAPLIVRSSSLLEDNFGYSFAGKYDSFFCPNQSTPEENLAALTEAIGLVYASVLSPDALLYRQQVGLVDYDERMGILIQKVQGQRYHDFFFPTLAGVGFSHNPFRWSRKIRPQDGLLRLVWGLGTRAVERVGNDYPRMVALSHPQLRPEAGASEIRKYSQHFVDLIDLPANAFKTLPVADVLQADYPNIQFLASQDKGDYLQPIYAPGVLGRASLVLTFDSLLKNQEFVTLMRSVLKKLERHYGRPVDVEFTVEITGERPPHFILHLLQCRPLSSQEWGENARVPNDVPPEEIVFLTRRLVPHGRVSRIRYIVYVDPAQYSRLPDYTTRLELARVIGRLNKRLEGENFILMGPGRWGTSNVELGLKVTYADIYNTRALIEIAQSPTDDMLEVSYGTHFFQDLVESRIYPLPLYLNAPDTVFNRAFFDGATNVLGELLPADAQYAPFIKVIDVPAFTGGRYLELVMDGEQDEAMAYLVQ